MQQSNGHFSHTIKTKAMPEDIWRVWTDVANWKDWDRGLRDATLSGSFGPGATGQIISLEGIKTPYRIEDFEQGQAYTIITNLPLGKLHVKRAVMTEGTDTIFSHEVWFSGISKRIFAFLFGRKFRRMLPGSMQLIEKIALDGIRP